MVTQNYWYLHKFQTSHALAVANAPADDRETTLGYLWIEDWSSSDRTYI